ncbi:hypothetical protein REB14_15750 [Chryseobacterium sp. ES2]|uniref:C1q domain-containing protein n=1 Tax=Chryseobacterium metallicongregator TaxID=3073042 RepID=A0ABU1E730_9FLAO|nr:hypothetical protein [Chryseobacterium sp. ES2]MDR4953633.1 hypothetical protein [Chryseobacterium sp. ES2]
MKKLISFLVLTIPCYFVQAQIGTNQNVENTLSNSNFFMDASKFNDFGNSIGKGLGFPKADLTKFKFDRSVIDNVQILSDFDGMMLYNYGNGNTVLNEGQQVAVTPGFYYFSNPAASGTVSNGKWVRLLTDVKSIVYDLKIPSNVLYARSISTSWKTGNNTKNPLWFTETDHINNEYITIVDPGKFMVNKAGLYTFDVRENFSDIPKRGINVNSSGISQVYVNMFQQLADYISADKGVGMGLVAGNVSINFNGGRWLDSGGYTFISTTLKLNAGDTFRLVTMMAKAGSYREAGGHISVMYTPIP